MGLSKKEETESLQPEKGAENLLKKLLKNEDGVTLVELLAALVILTLIVTSILAVFIQSARTSSQASDIDQATFLAQQQMEEMVYYSSNFTFEDTVKNLKPSLKDDGFLIITTIEGYSIETKISKVTNTKFENAELYKVLVTVNEGTTLRAQMENRLPFNKE